MKGLIISIYDGGYKTSIYETTEFEVMDVTTPRMIYHLQPIFDYLYRYGCYNRPSMISKQFEKGLLELTRQWAKQLITDQIYKEGEIAYIAIEWDSILQSSFNRKQLFN